MTAACPGGCNNRCRAAWRRYEAAEILHAHAMDDWYRYLPARLGLGTVYWPQPPEPPRIQPVPGDPIWCGECKAKIRLELWQLDDLADRVANLPPGVKPASDSRQEDVRVRTSQTDAPSPSPGADELEDLESWLLNREGAYRHLRRWPDPPPRGDHATTLSETIYFLARHLDNILRRPALAEDFGTKVRRWHRTLRAHGNVGSYAKFYPKPCPPHPKGCGRYTLWERPGEDYIGCINTTCNRRFTREEAARLPSSLRRVLDSPALPATRC